MPLHLEPMDVSADLTKSSSVLFVACPICPPVSLAMQRSSPVIEFKNGGLTSSAFKAYVEKIRDPLEERGVRTGVFAMYAPIPMMCLWTEGQRDRLRRRASDYETVVVLGCDSALHSVRQALEGAGCEVLQAMRTVGLTNATARFQAPMTVTLEEGARVTEGGKIER